MGPEFSAMVQIKGLAHGAAGRKAVEATSWSMLDKPASISKPWPQSHRRMSLPKTSELWQNSACAETTT